MHHQAQFNHKISAKMNRLDRYDLNILSELQRDARISNQDLAERIGLSPSPCSRRVKQLEDDGFILRQVALLDRKKLGLSLTAYVMVGMDRHTPERFERFEAAIRQCPEVLECSLVTGMDADYQLKVVVADMDHYQKFLLGQLTRIEGVTSVRSSFVLNQVLSSTELPLNHLRS
jgi:Lrp/AsnC family leucine-responsive transcriptional regulator